ncbi:heparinase [Pseudoduganella sp. FT93W]|uniref:Heparinase n=2 Tax=Duganella fentianensis TaxID=2692177 RepID=A0A845I6Y8_9BURK|nr:heparinase [Duganella fentianensis]
MGAGEIAHRVGDAIRMRLQARGVGLARPAPARQTYGQPWVPQLPRPAQPQAYVAAAEQILAGRFDVFSLRAAELGWPPRWNRDPRTGIEAPLVNGKMLNYRDEQLVGDIKYLWEPNRHLELVTLAQAWHLTGEARYAEGVRTLLDSWLQQCPYPQGPNWTSSLELAIRLMNWSMAWHLLGGAASPLFYGSEGAAFRERWLESVYRHCHFIAGYFSRHSSANNHLFGELAGLHIAALTWPCWNDSAAWLAQTSAELETQALLQNGKDGVNREQAVYYQHEVADMMLLCYLVGRANGLRRSAAYMERLEQLLEFLAALMDVGGQLPAIGDADDALLVRWNQQPHWNVYRSLLATGAVLFGRPDFKAKAGPFDDKSLWLLGEDGARRYARMASVRQPPCQAYREGGYYILGCDFDQPSEVRLVADAGPLGYLAIAAHGHADALALTLSVAGQPMLIDPGTYAYHTQKKWRDYFRGTQAHNTLQVDGLDQSESGGNFLWLRKATARCEAWHSDARCDSLTASHDGYLRLADPLLHRRRIEFLKDSLSIVIEDIIECEASHEIALSWHFDPACRVVLENGVVRVSTGPATLTLSMENGAAVPRLVCGAEQPPLGWSAPCFDTKVATHTVVWSEKIQGNTSRRTRIELVLNQSKQQTQTFIEGERLEN